MKWIGERTSFVDDKLKTTIIIDAENIGWQKALMGAWVSMWFTIGIVMTWAFFSLKLSKNPKDEDQMKLIIVIFMVFWAYYAFRVGRQFLWLLWGKEYLKVNESALYIKRGIKGYGKAHSYFLENIQKMRVEQPKENSVQSFWESSPWIRGGERLEFDYQGKVVKFGRKLNEKDAKILFNLITKRIEEQLRKRKK
jgi:hypothetical protein